MHLQQKGLLDQSKNHLGKVVKYANAHFLPP